MSITQKKTTHDLRSICLGPSCVFGELDLWALHMDVCAGNLGGMLGGLWGLRWCLWFLMISRLGMWGAFLVETSLSENMGL